MDYGGFFVFCKPNTTKNVGNVTIMFFLNQKTAPKIM